MLTGKLNYVIEFKTHSDVMDELAEQQGLKAQETLCSLRWVLMWDWPP